MPKLTVPAAGEAMPAAHRALPETMTVLVLLAAALRTRLFRLWLAVRLLRLSNCLADIADRLLDCVKREDRP